MNEKEKIEVQYEELFKKTIMDIITKDEYDLKLKSLSLQIKDLDELLRKYVSNIHNDKL